MKYFSIVIVAIFSLFLLTMCDQKADQQNAKKNISQPPAWAKDVIWYQIFVEQESRDHAAYGQPGQSIFFFFF